MTRYFKMSLHVYYRVVDLQIKSSGEYESFLFEYEYEVI